MLLLRSTRTLGNCILLTALLGELEQRFPGCEVDVMTRCPVAAQVYGNRFSVGRIIALPRHEAGSPLRTLRAYRTMRRRRYDLVIDPDLQSQGARLLALLANARFSLGFSGPRKSGALTHMIDGSRSPHHQAMIPVFLLRQALGVAASGNNWPLLDLRLAAAEKHVARIQLARIAGKSALTHQFIGIFANATGPKDVEQAWWFQFLGVIGRRAPQYTLIEILPADGRSRLDARYPCFYTSDIRKLGAFISQLAVFVGLDSGVMHVASASGTPTIGLFSVTDPDEWGPYGRNSRALRINTQDGAHAAGDVVNILSKINAGSSAPTAVVGA